MAKPTPYRERKLSSLGIVEKDAIEGSFIVEANCVKNCFSLFAWLGIQRRITSTRICLDGVLPIETSGDVGHAINARRSSTLDV